MLNIFVFEVVLLIKYSFDCAQLLLSRYD